MLGSFISIIVAVFFGPIVIVEVYAFFRNRKSSSYLYRWVTQESR